MPQQKKYPTKASTSYSIGDISFSELENFFSERNVFPLGSQILGRYLCLVRAHTGSVSKKVAIEIVASEVKALWEKGNVPSLKLRTVDYKVNSLVEKFFKVHKNKNNEEKKKQPWFQKEEASLLQELPEVFDIKLPDDLIPTVEKETGIPYGDEEKALYEDQISKTFLMKIAGVDKAWLADHLVKRGREEEKKKRKGRREEAAERLKKKWEEEKAADVWERLAGEAAAGEIAAGVGVAGEDMAGEDAAAEGVGEESMAGEHSSVENMAEGNMAGGEATWKDAAWEGRKKISQDVTTEKVILTRGKKRRLDTYGELSTSKNLDLKVRNSYSEVKNEVYDFLINFIADGSASTNQAILAAKLYAKHILHVDWLTESEAKEAKEKALHEGTFLPEDFYLYVLPSEKSVRTMREQYALAAEQQAAELILNLSPKEPVTHHGDSTTRSMTGKFFAAPLTVGNNLQLNVPLQKLCSETAEDVADVYELTYLRMGTLTQQPSVAFFKQLTAFMTDAAAEMNNFIPILKEKLGSEHQPFRLECTMHTTLGFTNCFLKTLSSLEQAIGPNNLFGASKCHDANNVVKSTVNAVMKFISPQFMQKPYNMKMAFDAMLGEKGSKSNDSFSFRSHRFGALEKSSIVVIYHWQDVLELCERVENRNDLIIFLRTVMECQFVKNMVISLALIGIHLIEPFTELVSTSNHDELQHQFQSLFKDLQNHKEVGQKAVNISESAIPTLKVPFQNVLEKEVYKRRWIEVLQEELDVLDDTSIETIQNVVSLYSHHGAVTLQRQRGSAYGFASSQGVQKDEVSLIPKEKLVKMPVTNLKAEQQFGFTDCLLNRLRTSSVKLASNHLVLRSSGCMVYGTNLAREVKKFKPEIDALQSQFDEKQKKKKSDAVMAMTGKAGLYHKKRLTLLEDCKSHGGPFTNPTHVMNFFDKCKENNVSEIEMKKAFKQEVTYARETLTKRPKSDDVFRIRDRITNKDLTAKQYADNLKALFSNILAVADVPEEVVREAIQKATSAAGIDYISADSLTDNDNPRQSTSCSIDSPNNSELGGNSQGNEYLTSELVAYAFKDDLNEKTWCLAMIDSILDSNLEISLYKPVPGRMGRDRVAYFPPDEDQAIVVHASEIIALPPIVTESLLDKAVVFIVNNHEEIDCFLEAIKEN